MLFANGYPANFIRHHVNKFIQNKHNNNLVKEHSYGPSLKPVYLRLPFKGQQNAILRQQLHKMFTKTAPWIKLITVFYASNKLSKLSKLKWTIPKMKQSKVIYKVACHNCPEFYIGMTTRRLKTRLAEHKKDHNSALNRHAMETDHDINFSDTEITATGSTKYRLQVKETLKIQEHFAFKSLNGNTGSLLLKLW